MSDRLTIVLTLKNRSAFTYRWMRYMNERRCPYPILIADGGDDRDIEAHLRDASNYPSLRYTYLRYPVDADYGLYQAKLAAVIDHVSTPYVQLADNDDFILLDANDACCGFLDAHPRTVSCGGRRYVLRLLTRTGALSAAPAAPRYEARLDRRVKSVHGGTPAERLSYFFRNVLQRYLWGAWYWVHRTEAVAAAFDKGRHHRFRDPVTHEAHVHMTLLSLGEYEELGEPANVIQAGSSQLTAPAEAQGTVVERFERVDAVADLRESVAHLAVPLSASERREVMDAIDAWLKAQADRRAPQPPPSLWQRWRDRSAKQSTALPMIEPYILG